MAKIERLLPFAGFAIIFCATSDWGQIKSMQGDIPFPFHVAERHLPAGNYSVMLGMPYTNTFTISSSDILGRVAIHSFWCANAQDSSALQSKLVFTKYRTDEYFLSEIWHPEVTSSMKLPQSKHEVVTSKLVTELRPEKVVIWAAVRIP